MKTKNQISAKASCQSKVCIPSYVMMTLSIVLGGFSILLFVVFLYAGLPSQIDLGLDEPANLYVNTLLCLLFFFQHSLMVRSSFRNWLSGFIPRDHLSAVFSIFSGLFLLILMLFWQKSTSFQVELDGAAYWFMRVLFWLSIIGFYITSRFLRPFDPFGIREIAIHLQGKTPRESFFTVRGSYRWVRHPLYLFCLLMIWAQVSVTTDRLVFNSLWTLWIITGTFLEERDLVASFGDAYRNYQRSVPMLIPYKWRPWNQDNK
ncbi:MAG: methyltransferase family protein [Thermodesulfobacteriota bacterium]